MLIGGDNNEGMTSHDATFPRLHVRVVSWRSSRQNPRGIPTADLLPLSAGVWKLFGWRFDNNCWLIYWLFCKFVSALIVIYFVFENALGKPIKVFNISQFAWDLLTATNSHQLLRAIDPDMFNFKRDSCCSNLSK